jgi:hypothetical protein
MMIVGLTPAIAGSLQDARTALENGDYVIAMDLARPLAERGDAGAERLLGQMYQQGSGTYRDLVRAATWFRKSADQGDTAAERALGSLYIDGQGVPKDQAMGLKWVSKAADHGDIDAMKILITLYHGPIVPADPAQEFRWTRKAAQKGDSLSQSNLCSVYVNGELSQAQSPADAFHWCKKAAEQGNFTAQLFLGDLYAVGEGVAQDKAQALAWYHKAAADPPMIPNRIFTQKSVKGFQDMRTAEVNQAISSLESGHASFLLPPVVDGRRLRARAEHGEPQAENDLANLYIMGHSGVPQDESQAAAWFRKAADQQFAPAAYNLADLYLLGRGVPRDDAQFLAWLQKGAELGLTLAQVRLARTYLTGIHAHKDPERGLMWFRRAAELGDAQAEFSLGAIYEQGDIVPKDLAQAQAWYEKAAAQEGFLQDDARQALVRLQRTAIP